MIIFCYLQSNEIFHTSLRQYNNSSMDSQSAVCRSSPQQKIFIANAGLILYFILPNAISFLLVIFLIGLNYAPCASRLMTCEKQCQYSVNSLFNQYLDLPLTKKVLVVLGAGLFSQISYLLPGWLILIVGVELWAAWDFLVEFGVVEVAQTQLVSAEGSLQKLFDMIPRYKGE